MEILDYDPNGINLDAVVSINGQPLDITITYPDFFNWAKSNGLIDVHCPSSKEVVIIDQYSGYFCNSRQEWVNTYEGDVYSYSRWVETFLPENESFIGVYLKEINTVGFQHSEAA